MRLRRFIAPLILLAGLTACKKDAPQNEAINPCGEGLQSATVVQGGALCNANGYRIKLDGGATYTPDGLPAGFQQNGLKVCLTYTVYEDPRMCPCCGGTRLRIQQIKQQ